MFPADLLELLRCPQSGQTLTVLGQPELAELNRRITAPDGDCLRNRSGNHLDEALEGGLVCADGGAVYPIRNGIPVLLPDEAILLRVN